MTKLDFDETRQAVRKIRERISAFSGYDDHMLEPLQVVRYYPGQKYEAHHDLHSTCATYLAAHLLVYSRTD